MLYVGENVSRMCPTMCLVELISHQWLSSAICGCSSIPCVLQLALRQTEPLYDYTIVVEVLAQLLRCHPHPVSF